MSNEDFDNRVLALAGLLQALAQVRRIADSGQSDNAATQTSLDSVFRIDADSPDAVYAGARNLRNGLQVLRDQLGDKRNEPLLKLAVAVLQLERRFIADKRVSRAVHDGVVRLSNDARERGSNHPDVLSALGALYSHTLSHLRPRVMVQGNPHYLAQPAVVAEIRALLLAAVRSAVLWRQMGGNWWDFAFSRKKMLQSAERWLR